MLRSVDGMDRSPSQNWSDGKRPSVRGFKTLFPSTQRWPEWLEIRKPMGLNYGFPDDFYSWSYLAPCGITFVFMGILVSHFPFHCFGQSSKDMSECSSDQLNQSVRIGGCFICGREWLARQKQLAGSIVLQVGFWRLSLPSYDSELVQPKTWIISALSRAAVSSAGESLLCRCGLFLIT